MYQVEHCFKSKVFVRLDTSQFFFKSKLFVTLETFKFFLI